MESPHRRIVVLYDRLKPYTGTKPNLQTKANSEPEVVQQSEGVDEEVDYNVVYVQENTTNGDQYTADNLTMNDPQEPALRTETSIPVRCSTRTRKLPDRYGNPVPH